MSYPDEFTRGQQLMDAKIDDFRAADPYYQIEFWNKVATDYSDALHAYLIDNQNTIIRLHKIAKYLYEVIDDADNIIIEYWDC